MPRDLETPTVPPAPPKAAAIAGVIFSILMGISLVIVRWSIPAETEPNRWLLDDGVRNEVRAAIQLVPFAGIAFLWFIGVFRDRVGAREDRFFASVFLGSGLLFVASLFASAAMSSALVEVAGTGRFQLLNNETFYLARQLAGAFLNVFAIKMAGVFIVSTSTIILRTSILPRWVPFWGYACALVLLVVITNWPWIALLFPIWMLVLSGCILLEEFRPAARHGSNEAAVPSS